MKPLQLPKGMKDPEILGISLAPAILAFYEMDGFSALGIPDDKVPYALVLLYLGAAIIRKWVNRKKDAPAPADPPSA